MTFEIIDSNTVFGPWPIVRADMSVERLVKALNNHGVSRALAICTLGALHNYNDGNAETLRVCSEQPMLLPVATIDPRGHFGSIGTVVRLAQQGFKMVRFFPLLQHWNPDHIVFCDILDELDSVNMPVMIQSRDTGYPSALARALGNRNVPLILESITFENMAEAVSVMRKHENVLVDTRALRVPGALRFLVDQVGSDRVVFGSGCLRSSLASALKYVLESDLPDEAKAKILGGNIKRLITS
ncbi:MAG: amidohydrolase family protein [Armatimonadota bacterium]